MSKFITYPQSLHADILNNPEIGQPIGLVEAYNQAKRVHESFVESAVIRDDNPKEIALGSYFVVTSRQCINYRRKKNQTIVEFLLKYYSNSESSGYRNLMVNKRQK
jgi:hypothetical protein